MWQFLNILKCIELSLQSGAHFADPIFQKCSEYDSFWTFWSAHRALVTVWCTFCRPNLPKVFRMWQFLNILKCTSSSRYSLVHILPTQSSKSVPWQFLNILKCTSSPRYSLVLILPTQSSKSVPNVTVFLTFWSAHRNLATVWRSFCRPNRPKVFRMWQFLNILKCISSSRYSRVFVDNLQVEPRIHRNRDPTFATPGATLPEKIIRFRARECFHPWIHTLPNCCTSQLFDDWSFEKKQTDRPT